MKYTKIIVSTLFVAIFAYAVVITPAFAIDTTDSGSTGAPVPATTDGGSTGTQTPATTDPGSTGGPATTDPGSTGGPVTTDPGSTGGPVTTDPGSTGGPVTTDPGSTGGTPTTPTNPGNGGNGGNGGGGNGGGGGGSTSVGGGCFNGAACSNMGPTSVSGGIVSTSTLPVLINISGCSYLTTYMKIGGDNVASEVTKLQTFLKNTEGLNVDVNGSFDQKTFDAVEAFQAKYVTDVMLPWGVTTPTGQVYYTTQKKINEIYCKTTFSLTAEQLAQIEAYRTSLQNGSITIDADGNVMNASSTDSMGTSTDVGTNGTNGSQEASVGASFFGKIWSFIKWIFGY